MLQRLCIILSVAGLFLAWVASAHGELYRYVDANGDLHVVSDLYAVPPEYRAVAHEGLRPRETAGLDMIEENAAPARPTRPALPARPRSVAPPEAPALPAAVTAADPKPTRSPALAAPGDPALAERPAPPALALPAERAATPTDLPAEPAATPTKLPAERAATPTDTALATTSSGHQPAAWDEAWWRAEAQQKHAALAAAQSALSVAEKAEASSSRRFRPTALLGSERSAGPAQRGDGPEATRAPARPAVSRAASSRVDASRSDALTAQRELDELRAWAQRAGVPSDWLDPVQP